MLFSHQIGTDDPSLPDRETHRRGCSRTNSNPVSCDSRRDAPRLDDSAAGSGFSILRAKNMCAVTTASLSR